METASAGELRESVPAEAPVRGDVPATAEAGLERSQPAQAKEAGDEPSAPIEPAEVVDLEAEDETLAPTEPAEVVKLGAKGGHPAPLELEAGGIAPGVGDEETPTNEGGAGPTTPPSSSSQGSNAEEPRWLPRFSAIDSGRLAERLLERVRLPRFREQFHHEPVARLFDATNVSVLQLIFLHAAPFHVNLN